jgi:hypothetical protein
MDATGLGDSALADSTREDGESGLELANVFGSADIRLLRGGELPRRASEYLMPGAFRQVATIVEEATKRGAE